MAEMCYYYWVHGRKRPSFFYNLPPGELTIIQAFYEREIEEKKEENDFVSKLYNSLFRRGN